MKILITFFSLFFFINIYGQRLPEYKVITPYYELYADSENLLIDAQKEMDYSIREFQKYFHLKIIPIAVIISNSIDRNNDDSLKLLPQKLGIKSRTYFVLDNGAVNAQIILAHEAAHSWLIAYMKENWKDLFQNDSTLNNDNYGHSKIPDWIDEMVAILCEHPRLKQKRRIFMRDSIDNRMPLIEVLSKRTQSSLFYNEMLSVMEFIIEKEGNVIVNTIVEESIRKKTIEEILKEHARNIPSDLAELEKQWVEWVKQK